MTSYVIIFVLSLLLLNVWMYFQQPNMIFYPIRELYQTPADWGLDHEDITLNTADNVQLHGWYIPARQSEQVLLFFSWQCRQYLAPSRFNRTFSSPWPECLYY